MPTVNKRTIENLKPVEAYKRGYLTAAEYSTHVLWAQANLSKRGIITFIYVNGVYTGTGTRKMKIHEIIEKFKL